MAKSTDWVPSGRANVLAMAQVWVTVLTANFARWNIPQQIVTAFNLLVVDAENNLKKAQDTAERTEVITSKCQAAFAVLTDTMRDIKKRYFYVPPLTDSDLISVWLHPHDKTPTALGAPNAQVTLEFFLRGRHELGVKIVYLTGSPDDHANKGYRIYYSVVEAGGAAISAPQDLRNSFFTKRKRDIIEFEFGDSGKTAYFAVQVENDGKKGPWGPIVSALIP